MDGLTTDLGVSTTGSFGLAVFEPRPVEGQSIGPWQFMGHLGRGLQPMNGTTTSKARTTMGSIMSHFWNEKELRKARLRFVCP
jgi:hypothetical protein